MQSPNCSPLPSCSQQGLQRYRFRAFFHSGSSLCRWIACRQRALRSFAAVYIGVNALYLYPRYAKEAFSSAWPWLLRYSNAWVLLMSAVGLMVSACPSQFARCCWHLLKRAKYSFSIVCSLVQLSLLVASFGYGEGRSSFKSQNVRVFNSEMSILQWKAKLRNAWGQ